jgi:uncharacterized protein (DUF4415 family)
MNKKSISRDSHTDWVRIKKLKNKEIDLSDIPEVSEEKISNAVLRFGGRRVPKGKVRINILLDADIVAYYKTISGGKGYQTLINESLKQNIFQHDLENILRQVIREELKQNIAPSAKKPLNRNKKTGHKINKR